jgi:hypothetical protein
LGAVRGPSSRAKSGICVGAVVDADQAYRLQRGNDEVAKIGRAALLELQARPEASESAS